MSSMGLEAGAFAGRLLLAAIFLHEAWSKLTAYPAATAVLFHRKLGDRNQLLHFEKDLAIAGGLLVLFAHGAGAWALDALRTRYPDPRASRAVRPDS